MRIVKTRAIRQPARFREEHRVPKLRGPYTLSNGKTGVIQLVRDAIGIFNATQQVARAMKTVPLFEARPSVRFGGMGGFAKGFIMAGLVVAVLTGKLHFGGR